MSLRGWLIVLILCFATTSVVAQDNVVQPQSASSTSTQYIPLDYLALMREFERASRPTFWQKLGGLISHNQDKTEDKNLQLGGNIGVGYTQETEAMFVATGVAQYSLRDSLPQSYTSLTGMLSLNGSYRARVVGNLCFSEKESVEYNLGGGMMPVRFWGLGYEMADISQRSRYTRGNFDASFLYRRNIAKGLTLGAGINLMYADACDVEPLAEEYLQIAGEKGRSAFLSGVTIAAEYDKRRYGKSSIRGYFLRLQGQFYPSIIGNQNNKIWNVDFSADYYQPLWYGAIIALDLYADMWTKSTPWMFWSKIGGDSRMRGYYYGRYTDRNMITAQAELRQTIYGPISGVVWGGAGTLFPSYSELDFNKVLPNYGVGIRISTSGGTSFRIDYGFGRHSNGLVINVNEAF